MRAHGALELFLVGKGKIVPKTNDYLTKTILTVVTPVVSYMLRPKRTMHESVKSAVCTNVDEIVPAVVAHPISDTR